MLAVELDHPVLDDLQRHAIEFGGLRAAGTMVDRRQRQPPAVSGARPSSCGPRSATVTRRNQHGAGIAMTDL